jgi:uncharacterized protein
VVVQWWEAAIIALAGLWAGLINAVVGSGTLVTFPVLVALGYPPVTATTSNAIGLITGSITGAVGYRSELEGQGRRLTRYAVASLLGAIVGAVLLLKLPADAFETVVPVLVGLSVILVLVQPLLSRRLSNRTAVDRTASPLLYVLIFLVGIYGGYFTAAQGIMLIAAMGALLPEDMQRMNAAKNLLSLVVNVVAALAYTVVAFDRISWPAAGLIAVGSLIGGFLGAHYGRRLSPNALRATIVVVGLIGLYRLLTV